MTFEWVKALNDFYDGKEIDPLVERVLRAVAQWHKEGESARAIVQNLQSGALFQVTMSVSEAKEVLRRIEKQEVSK